MARKPTAETSTANLGFEQKLWLTADKLRNNMDAAAPSGGRQTATGSPKGERGGANQYKRVVLGLIFFKYISDTGWKCRMSNAEIRIRRARPVRHSTFVIRHFPVPADARWSHLQASAKQPTIGKTADDAMVAIERDNPRLKGVLPKDYARPGLDKQRSQRRHLPSRRTVVADYTTAQIDKSLNR
jgi:type I restriction enzyme M protein